MWYKRLLVLFFAWILALVAIPPCLLSSNNTELNGDAYYKAVSQLISSRWESSYFNRATLTIGDNTLIVDQRIIKLDTAVRITQGSVMLPFGVLEALGIQVALSDNGGSLSQKGKRVEFIYGERMIRVDGEQKVLSAGASLVDDNPMFPLCVLSEYNYELIYDETNAEITITNEFQMARLVAKLIPGKTLPANIKATQVIAGPSGQFVLQFNSAQEAKEAYENLLYLTDVVYVEPDTLVTLEDFVVDYESGLSMDSFAGEYTHLGWGANRMGSDIFLDYLIANEKHESVVTVAVIDTGLDTAHPFFAERHVAGYNLVNNDTFIYDDHSHGTHVSGTIVDITIALPNVKIMPVKVLNSLGYGSTINVSNGIRWAADHGAMVINLSLGGLVFPADQGLDDSVAYAVEKNATVIAAAGNNSADAVTVSPARSEFAITVSAFDIDDKPAYFSNFGDRVDLAAPGVDIRSTIPGNRTAVFSGTSMSTPHVASAVALLLCYNSSLTPSIIKTIMCLSADPLNMIDGKHYGYGILNVERAVDLATEFIFATPNNLTEYVKAGPQQKQLTIEYYDKGMVSDVTSQTVFYSNDEAVATVTDFGLVTVFGVGQTHVIAEYDGKRVEISVIGLQIEPLKVIRSFPNNGDKEAVLTDRISITFNHVLVAPIRAWTLVALDGSKIEWVDYEISLSPSEDESEFCLILSKVLLPNTDYMFKVLAGDVLCDYGSLTEDYVLRFRTGTTYLPITNITVLPEADDLFIYETVWVKAEIQPFNASNKALSWRSSNNNVARIITRDAFSNEVEIIAVAAGIVTITALSDDGVFGSCTLSIRDPQVLPTSVSLSTAEMTIPLREVGQLVAMVSPQIANNNLTWTSSDRNVAVALANGIVYAQNPGMAIITATTVNGLTATCLVIVYPERLSFAQTTAMLFLGETLQLVANGVPPDYSLDWVSQDSTVATVSSSGLVSTESVGIVEITATAANGITATCLITIVETPLSITLSNSDIRLNTATNLQLSAVVLPFNAVDIIEWSSSDEKVATVSAKGIVNAVNVGTSIITAATLNGLTATCTVTVTSDPKRVVISQTSANMLLNGFIQLSATILPLDALDVTVTWSSSAPEVATVSADGLVVAKSSGSTKITATSINGCVDTCDVVVIAMYTIAFSANGGIGAPPNQIITSDLLAQISGELPTREGYLFQGWATNPSATVPEYQSGSLYFDKTDILLFAVWQSANESGGSFIDSVLVVVVGIFVIGASIVTVFSLRARKELH